jgi:MFS family permease
MTRSRPTLVLLLACVAQFMLLVDDTITNVALPTIGRDLHFSVANLSWVVNAYLLTFGGLLLVGGRLADRFGPRRVFAASLVGFAAATAPGRGRPVAARAGPRRAHSGLAQPRAPTTTPGRGRIRRAVVGGAGGAAAIR